MKRLFYYLQLLLFLCSCGKEDNYVVACDDLIGTWHLSGVYSYIVKTSDGKFDNIIVNNILNYNSKNDYISFFKTNIIGTPYKFERNCRRRGILGTSFTIDGDRILYATDHVEAFDLRLLNDTLFMSIDQTTQFNRDLKITSVQKVTIRNKYVRSN